MRRSTASATVWVHTSVAPSLRRFTAASHSWSLFVYHLHEEPSAFFPFPSSQQAQSARVGAYGHRSGGADWKCATAAARPRILRLLRFPPSILELGLHLPHADGEALHGVLDADRALPVLVGDEPESRRERERPSASPGRRPWRAQVPMRMNNYTSPTRACIFSASCMLDGHGDLLEDKVVVWSLHAVAARCRCQRHTLGIHHMGFQASGVWGPRGFQTRRRETDALPFTSLG